MRNDPLITDHALYWALGNTPFQREASYKALCERALTPAQTAVIEAAVLKGWPLGGDAFKSALARQSDPPGAAGQAWETRAKSRQTTLSPINL